MKLYRIPILILLAALLIPIGEQAIAQRSLTGRVISTDDSIGVEGINVEFMQANGTKKRTLTDKLGYYTISNITSGSNIENQTPSRIRAGIESNPSPAPTGHSTPSASDEKIKVYDDFGLEVQSLMKNDVIAWMDTIQWSGRNSRNARDGNAVYFISTISNNKIVAQESISFDSRASQGSVRTSAIIRFNYILKQHISNSN